MTCDTAKAADVIVAFVRTRAELGTDLNRDILRETLADRGVQPIRQVAIGGG
jgi:hypothetical protein